MKAIKIEADIVDWDIRRWLINGMTVEELVEFSRSIGFSMSEKDQRRYWRKLKKECERLLPA